MTKRAQRFIALFPLMLVGAALFVFLGGTIVKQLWNWLLPSLFGLPAITFWQALGLLALSRILFGGLGMYGSSRSRMRRRMAERCERTTPEERERYRERMRAWWGAGPSTGESQEG